MNNMNNHQSWRQGRFIYKDEYKHMSQGWIDRNKQREMLLVRPSPTGNAICQCHFPEDAKWITQRLNLAAELESRNFPESKEENQNSALDELKAWHIRNKTEVTVGESLKLERIISKISSLSFGENNKPSAKCYSVDCPAIWNDKCTSTKYSKCSVLDAE